MEKHGNATDTEKQTKTAEKLLIELTIQDTEDRKTIRKTGTQLMRRNKEVLSKFPDYTQ